MTGQAPHVNLEWLAYAGSISIINYLVKSVAIIKPHNILDLIILAMERTSPLSGESRTPQHAEADIGDVC